MSPGHAQLRVLIVDDEPLASQRVQHLLDEQPNVSVVGTCGDGRSAIEAIRRTSPDVVVLDMKMPRGSGLDVVRKIGPEQMPVTIFVTAHDDFAVEAFELAATDYLLKPYSDERFEEAFRRARARLEMKDLGTVREQLRAVLDASGGHGEGEGGPSYLRRIAVQNRGRMRVIPVAEIDCIVSSGVYAELVIGRERHLIRASLNTLETRLDPEHFLRIHRSAIVKLDEVRVLLRERGGSYLVQLENGTRLPVGRSRREELERRLGRI
jgi:two-component system LytT family response regulator